MGGPGQGDGGGSTVRPVGEPWPLAAPRAVERLAAGGGFLLELAVGLLSQGLGSSLSERPPSVAKTVQSLNEGCSESYSAAVFGSADWCPRHPDTGSLRLAAGTVAYSQGLDRPLPIGGLAPREVHAPRTVRTPQRLPRSWWVLEVAGSAGHAFIAAPTDCLAVLGAVAGWPAPRGWPYPRPE